MAVQPQAGGGVPGGTGSSQVPITITERSNRTSTGIFRKNFQIYSAGYQFSKMNNTFIKGPPDWSEVLDATTSTILTTPLSVIDPNALPWYMTQTEWNNLPTGSTALDCTIKVTPVGYRLPFATNDTQSGYANSQTLVQVLDAVGLNTALNAIITGYTSEDTDFSKVTNQAAVNFDVLVRMLYGGATDIGCNTGIARHNNFYFVSATPTGNCTPNLMEYINIHNINDVKGTPLINYSYKFKEGLLKAPSTTQFKQVRTGAGIWEGKNPQLWGSRIGGSTDGADTSARLLQLTGARSISDITFQYQNLIEKCAYMSRYATQIHSPEYVPLVCFGVLPVQANPALATLASFANVVAQWDVETTLRVQYDFNFLSPNIDTYYLHLYDPIFGDNDLGTQTTSHPYLLIANRRYYASTDWTGGTIAIPNKGPFRPPT
uniref:Putative VP1 protein n=1 Tax=Phoenicurus auroreus parvoviridae sp. TaxID=2794531 RepID=A0A8A4XDH1_9VIRU|nr:MAG: putative VP1 protein [Phoenicurus auroreus parvoviridae sp.]